MANYCKRLIEVDLPIRRISAHARREKSIRHGHISTLHIWWARRPLAACRAVICASLWPDPADELCPEQFRTVAREQMIKWAKKHLNLCSKESYPRFNMIAQNYEQLNDLNELRASLLDFIADFSNWSSSLVAEFLEIGRLLTQSAHEAMGGEAGSRPLVIDPFAGGGAIPLEALRVGANSFASDLNPVAVLLNKIILEYAPTYGSKLYEEVEKWGHWIKKEAEDELSEFYPKDPDGANPIAYLWARTIKCEGPTCGAEVPLIRSLWLAKNQNRTFGLKIIPNPLDKRVDFEIIENPQSNQITDGTVKRGGATCPCCGYTTPVNSVRSQLKSRKGGTADSRMFAVVTTRPSKKGRFYRLPISNDLSSTYSAKEELFRRVRLHKGSLSLIPNESTPSQHGHRSVSSMKLYGFETFGDLFTHRQLLALTTLVRLVIEAGRQLVTQYDPNLAEAIQSCLAIAVDTQADSNSSLCSWRPTTQDIGHTFGRQALPMMWDFVEANIFSGSTRDWTNAISGVLKALESIDSNIKKGHTEKALANDHPLPDNIAHAFITDPPYYDSVAYADLSDFFFVWLKRSLAEVHKDWVLDEKTPNSEQTIVWHPNSIVEKKEFEKKMAAAMTEGRRLLALGGIGVVVFAHKSTGGWESQLQSMIKSGWIITASWPIDTEMGSRINAINTASLASSIHLVCRPREYFKGADIDEIGDWRDILDELPKRIHEWMPRLAEEGVVGADAIFACLGPALEIYSRYSSVEKASGEKVELSEYLQEVWAAVSREALAMIFKGADASGFEEDARLTAMWLWTLRTALSENGKSENSEKSKSLSGYALEYDAARKIAQGLGAHLEKLSHLVEIKGDTAVLLSASARTKYLFGKDAAEPSQRKRHKAQQQSLFDSEEMQQLVQDSESWQGEFEGKAGATVLDQLHQSMILFAAGRGDAMKRFLVEGGVGRNPLFWRLAQALSALYPAGTDEKRWIDGVLARKKGMGL
ncbi:DUF1156 domain-containing protein [candidate division KSB1 bacterium]|nr:DUF1156 domain-containing protein [candidate division KSB1 bacterium]RQW02495.1 MAG: DUF1156 domain-containing protein [candidate division KSB1 bacterium]